MNFARTVIALTAILLIGAAPLRASPLIPEAQRLFNAGNYQAAERVFLAAQEAQPEDGEALLGLAQVYERTGQYDRLQQSLDEAKNKAPIASMAKTMAAEHLVRMGRYNDAKKAFEAILDKEPDNLRAMIALGELYYLQGAKSQGDRIMGAFTQLYNKGKATTPEALAAVGVAMFHLESYNDANLAFTSAMEADANYLDGLVLHAQLFLEKYNQREANQLLAKALAIDPNHPEARVALARLNLETWDIRAARAEAERALSVNPNLLSALNIMAEILMMDEAIDSALIYLDRALAINPNHLPSLALKASAYYLDDDTKAQKAVEKQVTKINPRYARLYETIARFAEYAHRYDDVVTLYEKALKIDPAYWRAYVGLGTAYMRSGDDKKSAEFLAKAFDADPWNVRAFNMIELYDRTLPHYRIVERGPLRFRFHKDEKEILELYVPPLVEGMYNVFTRKYGYTPPGTITLELFPDPVTFSKRSVGLPLIDPQGICFGKVITALSPSQGNFNWAQVLTHELAHSFHLALSRSRVPRWFTEGLAEYETIVARREWQREHHIELWSAFRNGEIPSIAKLNQGFMEQSLHKVVVAYYLSSLVIEFIDERHGFDAIVQMLTAWGQSQKTPEVFQNVLNMAIPEFDQAFHAWLEQRFGYLDKSHDIDPENYVTHYQRYLDAAAAAPQDATALADAGLAELFALRIDAARDLLAKAIAIDPKNTQANYLGGILALREGNYEKAQGHYQVLLDANIDGYTIRIELGHLHLMLKQNDKAIVHLDKAKSFFPKGVEPYLQLSRLYLSQNDHRKARQELEGLLEIDQHSFATAQKLFELTYDAGEHNRARRFGEIAIDINPFDPGIHGKLADIGVRQQDWLLAEREFKALLALTPREPLDAYLGLALVYLELGLAVQAKAYLELARAVSPNEPRISAIEARLK